MTIKKKNKIKQTEKYISTGRRDKFGFTLKDCLTYYQKKLPLLSHLLVTLEVKHKKKLATAEAFLQTKDRNVQEIFFDLQKTILEVYNLACSRQTQNRDIQFMNGIYNKVSLMKYPRDCLLLIQISKEAQIYFENLINERP